MIKYRILSPTRDPNHPYTHTGVFEDFDSYEDAADLADKLSAVNDDDFPPYIVEETHDF